MKAKPKRSPKPSAAALKRALVRLWDAAEQVRCASPGAEPWDILCDAMAAAQPLVPFS